jgi:biotin carboxylase
MTYPTGHPDLHLTPRKTSTPLMALRIWLNRTFATNYHVVNMLKKNPDRTRVQVLGSHVDPDSPVLTVCDEQYSEPVHLTADDYVEYALGFCRDHRVDVFWPTWQQEAIAHAAARFATAGVTVMVSGADAIRAFDDKAHTYRIAQALNIPVPEHHIVTTVDEFATAYTTIKDNGHAQVCFKPTVGVGAEGFRIVSNGPRTFESLSAKAGDHISYDETVALLSQREVFAPLMVMPFLAGGEASVDTIAFEGDTLMAVPRFKRPGTRAVELLDAPHLVKETAKLVAEHKLSYLANAQFRFDDAGEHFLLEVNTRASGGLFQSCLAGGNMPWLAVQVALNGPTKLPAPTFPVRLVTLPTAVTTTAPA